MRGICGEISGKPPEPRRVSQGLVGTGMGQEVSNSRQKAELKPLWSRALPAAARETTVLCALP